MSIKWKSIVAALLSVTFFTGNLSTAYASSDIMEEAFTPKVVVTNTDESVSLTVNLSDSLVYVKDEGGDWRTANVKNEKNGFSNVYFFNDTFVATSYYKIYFSKDGENWTSQYLPVGDRFNPEEIIEDGQFYTTGTMTANEIQNFLKSKSACKNSNCLANYREYTKSQSGQGLCKDYSGNKWQSAAEIIYNVSKACNIAAEVILATLEKEQGLISNDAPTSGMLRTAMGYACPDTADCNRTFFGFFKQVWHGSKQFQDYRLDKSFYNWYPVGQVSNVKYQAPYGPNCGGSSVRIKNNATAALYYYTPYQPNEAALKNLWGSGDECSAYGNRNFWRTYNAWFNDTKSHNVSIVQNGSTFFAYDSKGSVATSKNLKDWTVRDGILMPDNLTITNVYIKNDKFFAGTNIGNVLLVSSNGLDWMAKETVELTVNKNVILETKTPLEIYIGASTTELDGTVKIIVDGSEYDTVALNEKNYQNGIITLPSFILNDGTHDLTLIYGESERFFNAKVEMKATVGSPKEAVYHVVRRGETLNDLSKEYNNTEEWIMDANALSSSDVKVGTKLKVKYIYNTNLLTTSPIYEQYHTVFAGDTLMSISLKYRVNIDRIKKLNNLSVDSIYVGQKIRYA